MVLSTSAQSSSRSSGLKRLGRGVGERVRMSVDRARLVQCDAEIKSRMSDGRLLCYFALFGALLLRRDCEKDL